jgi:hypothetical protein
MKYFKLMIWVMAIAMIFFSCSKDNTPTINDNVTNSFKAQALTTDFTGTSIPVSPSPPGSSDPNVWYDEAIDAVTGITIWVTEGLEPQFDGTINLWGTTELFVGAETYAEVANGNYDGKWEMKWYGTQTFDDPNNPETSPFVILAYAVGVGTEGNVKGMFAEWTYTMDILEGFFYTSQGYVAPKQLTNTLKTIKSSGSFEVLYPSNECGDYIQLHIFGSGNCSHLGKFTVENFVCFYFYEGMIVPVGDWLGYITAANGKDEIHTQLIYSWVENGQEYYLYDIIDGEGKFEDASGYLEMYGITDFINSSWYLEGEGIIVH